MATLVRGIHPAVYECLYLWVHDFDRAGTRARGVLEAVAMDLVPTVSLKADHESG